jgi:hypothetical protein
MFQHKKTHTQAHTHKYTHTHTVHFWCRINRQCTCNLTMKCVTVTIFAAEKQQILHILSVSVAFVIQHARRMRRIILSSVASLALPHFSLCHKRHDFRGGGGGGLLNIKCVFCLFSTPFVWNISRSMEKWSRYDDKYILVFLYSARHSCHVLTRLDFSWRNFRKTFKYQIS